MAAVLEALRSDFLTQGPRAAAFEAQLAELLRAPYAVAFSSGTAALHAPAFVAGAGPGDEVVTSALTFAASANCAAYVERHAGVRRHRPGDLERVRGDRRDAVVTERARTIIPVGFTGLPAPVAEIRARGGGDDVVIIEDAARDRRAARGQACRRDADAACSRFHPVKTVTTGEDSAIALSDPELHQRLLDFRSHGMTRPPRAWSARTRAAGTWSSSRPAPTTGSPTCSALAAPQLAKTEQFVTARNAIADRYRAELGGVVGLSPTAPDDSRHAYHLFVVSVEQRRAVYDALRERAMLAQIHYLPVYLHPYYRDAYGYAPGLCPEAEAYYADCLSLPCFPALTEDEQTTVVAAVRDVVG